MAGWNVFATHSSITRKNARLETLKSKSRMFTAAGISQLQKSGVAG
jgi:hypothetical protein